MEVAGRWAGVAQYIVLNTDSNGNYTSPASGLVSGGSTALEAFEPSFQQDLNGDGVVGVRQTVIEGCGATHRTQVGSQFALLNAGGAGPTLKFGGVVFEAGSVGGLAPIGAEA